MSTSQHPNIPTIMYCPQCRSEYRQGFTRCSDCDVDLIWELPRDDHRQFELVKVLESGNPALIPIIESLLHDAGIECIVKNQVGHRVLGSDLASAGAAQFWVSGDDAAEARELLAGLSRYDVGPGRE